MNTKSFKSYFSWLPFTRKPAPMDDYWIQKLRVERIHNRMEILEGLCRDKKVIHFGCTDYPLFDPDNNLHIELSKICNELHGFDIDKEGIEVLKKYYDSIYFDDFSQIGDKQYDICLVPETIEHVDNVAMFMKSIDKINCELFYISAPNCFHSFFNNHFEAKDKLFIEAVHPDHNSWFSPYTLKNSIEKYSSLKVENIYLCNNDIMVICVCTKTKKL